MCTNDAFVSTSDALMRMNVSFVRRSDVLVRTKRGAQSVLRRRNPGAEEDAGAAIFVPLAKSSVSLRTVPLFPENQ